jgi:hypothetical protein
MPVVRFAWSPMLVDLRREVCPGARWQKPGRLLVMSETDAQAFIRAAQARLDFQRLHAQISVDGTIWSVGSCAVPHVNYHRQRKRRRIFSPRFQRS